MNLLSQNGIPDIVKMGNLTFIHQNWIFNLAAIPNYAVVPHYYISPNVCSFPKMTSWPDYARAYDHTTMLDCSTLSYINIVFILVMNYSLLAKKFFFNLCFFQFFIFFQKTIEERMNLGKNFPRFGPSRIQYRVQKSWYLRWAWISEKISDWKKRLLLSGLFLVNHWFGNYRH